jgi:hypothetical protein
MKVGKSERAGCRRRDAESVSLFAYGIQSAEDPEEKRGQRNALHHPLRAESLMNSSDYDTSTGIVRTSGVGFFALGTLSTSNPSL